MQRLVKGAGAAAARGAGGDPLTPAELAAWRGLLRVHAELRGRLDDDLRREHRLSLSAYEALMLVAGAPRPLRVSELSRATLLSVSGVSRLIDRLVGEGLLVKEACSEDGRGAEVRASARGRRRLAAARATHLAGVRALFLDRLSDGELAALATAWETVLPGVGDGP